LAPFSSTDLEQVQYSSFFQRIPDKSAIFCINLPSHSIPDCSSIGNLVVGFVEVYNSVFDIDKYPEHFPIVMMRGTEGDDLKALWANDTVVVLNITSDSTLSTTALRPSRYFVNRCLKLRNISPDCFVLQRRIPGGSIVIVYFLGFSSLRSLR
jgi:hypothetical protein